MINDNYKGVNQLMKPHKILVTDDDLNILHSINNFLTGEGFDVTTVKSGEKAIELLNLCNFDLVITDMVMGDIDGIDVLKMAKEKNPDTKVIILTGYREVDPAIDSLRLKADDYLLKPCEPEDLLFRVSSCLKQLELQVKHRQTEQALKESEKKYRNLVESTHDQIWSIDLKGKHNFANKVITEILGYDINEVNSQPIDSFIHPDDKKQIKELFDKCVEQKCGWKDVVIRWLNKNGSTRFTESRAIPAFDSQGELIGFHGVACDITVKKRVEAEILKTKKLESIGNLSSGIAHNFNNLLAIILGSTELALDDVPAWNPVHSYLQHIQKASLKASELVKQLLSFSRLDDQQLEEYNAVDIIKDSFSLLRSVTPSTIDINLDIKATSDRILASPLQMNQILMNLFSNASLAMDKAMGTIDITIDNEFISQHAIHNYPSLKQGKYLKIAVHDSGSGIEPSIIDRIFDPFFTTRDVGKGFGMGLSVVHGIVEKHNGAIIVDSQLGEGTTINLFFPLTTQQSEIKTVSKDMANKSDEILSGNEKILLVDDEHSVLLLMRIILERLGYQVESTTDPLEALNLFCSNPDRFDLVLSDMIMPKMTGDMLFDEVMKVRKDIPFIICTGHSEFIDEEKAKAIGIAKYIMKPIQKNAFAKAIRNVLDNIKN